MDSRQDEVLDAAAGLHDLINGYWRSQVLCTAARLGVPDLLAGGPLTLGEMAVECGLPCANLARLMRALVGLGVCTVGEEGYRTTALGRALETGAAGGAHERALVTAELFYPMWADLTDCLCRGGSAVEIRSAGSPIDLPGPQSRSVLFDQAMEDLGEQDAERIAAEHPLPAGAVVVDVGGRADALLAELLHTHPDCRGVLYDLPGATERARSSLAELGLAGRTNVAEGDFLVDVPSGGDVYLLSFVLHAWDDDRATALLRAVRRAMKPGALLLVVEQMLPGDDGGAAIDGLRDLHLLVTTGGRERSEAEYAELLASAGLRPTGTRAVDDGRAVLEARPVSWPGFGAPVAD